MSDSNDAVTWHSEIAARFDARYSLSPAFRERLAVWSSLIARYGGPSMHVLDAGCGSGVLTFVAARACASVVGFDASPEMLALARQKLRDGESANVELLSARLPDLAFLGGRSFDLVMSSSVLEYMDDLWQSIDALTARVTPGGVLIVSLPNGQSIYRQAERLSYRLTGRPRYFAHVRHVPRQAEIAAGLHSRGFAIEEIRCYGPIPGLSPLSRKAGLARFSDNLFVVVARNQHAGRQPAPVPRQE